ncbi:DUF6207 family protein [Streptomyces canus]|uniref:DUF6207 family protein n=1 Tax=Streptomyces canus TaxID=58343 RepID=UPI002254A5DC|nr:DUF6207 family protein [Streptomyces canus]MCX5256766.1 DUF6207 family protein [Streptomyces canus]
MWPQPQERAVSTRRTFTVTATGADEGTVMAFRDAVARTLATAPAEHVMREPGRPGVRIRLYTDLRQGLPRPVDAA